MSGTWGSAWNVVGDAPPLPEDKPWGYEEKPYEPAASGTGSVDWGDWGRAAWGGTMSFGGSIAGFVEFLGGPEGGQAAGAVREMFQGEAQYQNRAMGPEARTALNSSVLPGENDDSAWETPLRSLGIKAVATLPTMVASLLPGVVVARGIAAAGGSSAAVRAGAGAAVGGTNLVGSGGDVFASMAEEFGRMDDAEKQAGSSAYRTLREAGMEEEQATRQVISEAAGFKPLYAGMIAAAAGYGLTGRAVADIAGTGVTRGIRAGAMQGARSEAGEEAIQTGAESGFAQAGMGALTGQEFDVRKFAADVLEGTIMGATMGGGMGAVGGMIGPGNAPGADQALALSGQAVTPGVTPPAEQEGPRDYWSEAGEGSQDSARTMLQAELAATTDPEMRRRLEEFGRSTGLLDEMQGPQLVNEAPRGIGPRDDWTDAGEGDAEAAGRLLEAEIRNARTPEERRRLEQFGRSSGILAATPGVDLGDGAPPVPEAAATQQSPPARPGQASRPGPNTPVAAPRATVVADPVAATVADPDQLAALAPPATVQPSSPGTAEVAPPASVSPAVNPAVPPPQVPVAPPARVGSTYAGCIPPDAAANWPWTCCGTHCSSSREHAAAGSSPGPTGGP